MLKLLIISPLLGIINLSIFQKIKIKYQLNLYSSNPKNPTFI